MRLVHTTIESVVDVVAPLVSSLFFLDSSILVAGIAWHDLHVVMIARIARCSQNRTRHPST